MRTAVVGHIEWVELIRVPRVPRAGEIVHGDPWWEGPAGGGAAAAVQLMKLAGTSALYTALGDDALGHRAKAELEGMGLEVHAAFRDEPTRRASVLIDDQGERTITVIGSRLEPRIDDLLPWDEVSLMDAVYVTAADAGAVRRARDARVLVATSRVLERLREAGVQLDALVGSASDPGESFGRGDLVPHPSAVFLTEGGRGGRFQVDGEWKRYEAVAVDKVVDRYGAGDAFAAGITYALGIGMGAGDAADLAAACGSAVLGGRGPYEGQIGEPRLT